MRERLRFGAAVVACAPTGLAPAVPHAAHGRRVEPALGDGRIPGGELDERLASAPSSRRRSQPAIEVVALGVGHLDADGLDRCAWAARLGCPR